MITEWWYAFVLLNLIQDSTMPKPIHWFYHHIYAFNIGDKWSIFTGGKYFGWLREKYETMSYEMQC